MKDNLASGKGREEQKSSIVNVLCTQKIDTVFLDSQPKQSKLLAPCVPYWLRMLYNNGTFVEMGAAWLFLDDLSFPDSKPKHSCQRSGRVKRSRNVLVEMKTCVA